MIKKLKTALLTLSAIMALGVPMLAPAVAGAASVDQIQQGLCSGANLNATDVGTSGCAVKDSTATTKINTIITLVINIFSFVVGIAAVIMIIVGGLMYITSAGDSGKVTSAKNTILYAIIGLVVVALSQFIVRFVLTKLAA